MGAQWLQNASRQMLRVIIVCAHSDPSTLLINPVACRLFLRLTHVCLYVQWQPQQLRIKASRLMGSQSLARYTGNKVSTSRHTQAHKRVARSRFLALYANAHTTPLRSRVRHCLSSP
eukprot:6349836-Pyramimonas_sp.AAC.2